LKERRRDDPSFLPFGSSHPRHYRERDQRGRRDDVIEGEDEILQGERVEIKSNHSFIHSFILLGPKQRQHDAKKTNQR